MPATQKAKREGKCNDCEMPIKVGDEIHFIVSWGFVHLKCEVNDKINKN